MRLRGRLKNLRIALIATLLLVLTVMKTGGTNDELSYFI
jgi:hypothetical protein